MFKPLIRCVALSALALCLALASCSESTPTSTETPSTIAPQTVADVEEDNNAGFASGMPEIPDPSSYDFDESTLPSLEEVQARLVNGDPVKAWVYECTAVLSGRELTPNDSPFGGTTGTIGASPEQLQKEIAAGDRCGNELVYDLGYADRVPPTEAELRESYKAALVAVECFEDLGFITDFETSLQEYLEQGVHQRVLPIDYSRLPEQDDAVIECLGDHRIIYADSEQ